MNQSELKLWRKKDTYTLAEAALLIVGQSPDKYSIQKLIAGEFPTQFSAVYSAMVEDAKKEIGIVESDHEDFQGQFYMEYRLRTYDHEGAQTKTNEQWLSTSVSKGSIQEWAKLKGFPAVFDDDYKMVSNMVKENEENSTERESMIKIIHALAKNGYRYPAHGSLKEMITGFETNNNGVSENTLRKYLEEFGKL